MEFYDSDSDYACNSDCIAPEGGEEERECDENYKATSRTDENDETESAE